MLIRLGYDIQFDIPAITPMVALLHVHPSRQPDLREPDVLGIEPSTNATEYIDGFGNRCTRFVAQPGLIRLFHSKMRRMMADFWKVDPPDLLVSVIPNFNRVLLESYQRAKPGGPMVTILTDIADYPPHFWIERQRQYLICGSDRAVQQARALGHEDRFIRFAARVAIEHQDPKTWQSRALSESDPARALTALLALVRVSADDPQHHPKDTKPVDAELKARLLEALDRLAWERLTDAQRLDLLRIYSILFVRMGPPDTPRARK